MRKKGQARARLWLRRASPYFRSQPGAAVLHVEKKLEVGILKDAWVKNPSYKTTEYAWV